MKNRGSGLSRISHVFIIGAAERMACFDSRSGVVVVATSFLSRVERL